MSVLETLLSQETITRLGWMLVHFLWQATAVALLLAGLLRLLRRTGANLRYTVACGALALMVVLPVITMQLVDVPGPAAEAGPLPEILPPAEVEPLRLTLRTVEELPPMIATPLETADVAMSAPWQERMVAAFEPALPYLVLGWLAGVFGLSAWHLGGWTQLHRLKHRMARESSPALRATLDDLAAKLGVRRAVAMLESALVEVPTVLGWLRPVILLPASVLTGLNPDQLRAILAHELAHIRRYDYLANIVQTLVEILGFYHPAVWWVSSRIRIERENCCDDLAVQVCGDSLQYARALTSLEEMRHSRSDLALAASGGSLMARIARLLGRPVVDDRRFAWLPGLIALLLVVGVVIPTAFALTHSAAGTPESPIEDASVATDQTQDATSPDEPVKRQIMMEFVLADIFSDAVLDPQTAAEASALLERIPNGDQPTAPPTAEELQQPLERVLSEFAPAPGRGKEFVVLLGRKGYAAGTLSAPRVTAYEGEPVSFSVGEIPKIDAPVPEDSQPLYVKCDVAGAKIQDPNAIRLDVHLVRLYRVYKPTENDRETAFWTVDAAVLASNDQWTLIPDAPLRDMDNNGRRCLQLALVRATLVAAPQAADTPMMGVAPGATLSGQIANLPPGMGAMVLPTSPNSSQVLIRFSLFPAVSSGKVVDIETRNLVAGVLAKEDLQALREVIHADPQKDVTLGELLKTWIANRPMTPETLGVLIDVLQSRGYVGGENTPEVLAHDGQQAHIRIGAEKLTVPSTDPASAPQSLMLGTFVQVTPRIPPLASDRVVLEIAAQWKERIDPNDTSSRPAIRETTMATTIAIPFGKSAALIANPAGGRDDGLRMLLVSPAIFAPAQSAEGQAPNANVTTIIKSPPEGSTPDSNARQVHTSWVIAEARMETALDRETLRLIGDVLAGERPQIARELTATRQEITLGHVLKTYVARQSLSQETGQALIDLLETRKLATVLATPALISWDGQQAELRSVSEEWFSPRRLRIVPAGEEPNLIKFEYGTIIKNTARIEQDGSLTLDMAVSLGKPGSKTDPNALPVVHRMGTSTTVTMPADRYFSLLVDSSDETVEGEDAKSLLIMVRSNAAKPPARADDSPAASTRQEENHPRHVLLDARVVEIEPTRLKELGISWSFPSNQQDEPDDDWTRAIQVGYLPDSGFTNSFLAALNRLETTNRARLVSNPQAIAQEGRSARLRSSREEWFLMSDPSTSALSPELRSIESGTMLDVTCRIGDSNEITLEVSVEVSNSVARRRGSDLPIVTRRQARNSLTVMNGGTVAVAGFRSGRGNQTRETAIFITATLVSDAVSPISSLPSHKEMASSTSARRVEPALPASASAAPVGRPLESGESPARKTSDRKLPRVTLLDTRIVEIERTDLTNLIAQWNLPAAQAGQIPADGRQPEEIRIAFLSDRAHTDSFWEELRLLATTRRARIMANPQVVSTDGHTIELLSFGPVWAHHPDTESAREVSRGQEECRRVLAGTSLLTTSTVGDSNDITLEMKIGPGDKMPKRRRNDRPTVMHRVAQASVTVMDGGIVAVTGLPVKSASRAGQRTKEIAIFITATRVPDISEVVAALPSSLELSDPLARVLSEEIAKAEKDLIVLRQTHMEANPEVARQKALLKALKDRLEDRRAELKREHESDLRKALNRTGEGPESSSSADVGASSSRTEAARTSRAFIKVDLFRELAEISRRFAVKVAVDLSVKTQQVTANLTDATPEAAIRQVLEGTPYQYRILSAPADRPTCLVYRPITADFQGVELMHALDQIAMMVEVPIIPSPSVEGTVTARLSNVDLETALKLVLAETPFVFRNMGNYYVAGDRQTVERVPPVRQPSL